MQVTLCLKSCSVDDNIFCKNVLQVKNREEAIPAMRHAIAESGPYQAFMILMGASPFENFDYSVHLLPDLKIIVSASAGYDEFLIEWMTENGVWFCNTSKGVAKFRAEMAMFLTLAVVRDATRSEKSAKARLWRTDHVPCTDPTGLTLGIIGLGATGKARIKAHPK